VVDTVIVAVHVHLNDTLIVIRPVGGSCVAPAIAGTDSIGSSPARRC
jgi:hypothetical protein